MLGLQFQGNRSSVFLWMRVLTRAGAGLACHQHVLGVHGPHPRQKQAQASFSAAPGWYQSPSQDTHYAQELLAVLGSQEVDPAQVGAPRAAPLCQDSHLLGPAVQRVSWGRLCGGAWAPLGQSGDGAQGSFGVHRDPSSRAPEAAADLPMYRHLLRATSVCPSAFITSRTEPPAWSHRSRSPGRPCHQSTEGGQG